MSGFTFTPTSDDGATAVGLDGLVYLNVKTCKDMYEISGYVKPEVAALVKAAPELFEALKGLYEDQLDYIRINNLSGAENNHWMVAARAALAKVTGEENV